MTDRQIFKLSATYNAAPDATATDLLDDATLLMGVVRDSLSALAMSVDGEDLRGSITDHKGFCQLLYGLGYLAEISTAAAGAAQSIVMKSNSKKHSQ